MTATAVSAETRKLFYVSYLQGESKVPTTLKLLKILMS